MRSSTDAPSLSNPKSIFVLDYRTLSSSSIKYNTHFFYPPSNNLNKKSSIFIPDDVVLQDDETETQWQDRVSSGFDRLVAFASTELDKTRRSIEDTSCNTSPDSGINNSDGRNFLSSSSSSSQLDLPHINNNLLKTSTVTIIKTSPNDIIDSPPLSDVGLPRTPSPSTSPNIQLKSSSSSSSSSTTNAATTSGSRNNLKIPLKYQRQSKAINNSSGPSGGGGGGGNSSSSSSNTIASSEKHYKKKFRDRKWDTYDFDESMSSTGSTMDIDGVQQQKDQQKEQQQQQKNIHKSSKFRPKGKDWDWKQSDGNSGGGGSGVGPDTNKSTVSSSSSSSSSKASSSSSSSSSI